MEKNHSLFYKDFYSKSLSVVYWVIVKMISAVPIMCMNLKGFDKNK